MSDVVTIAYLGEGLTDQRFLGVLIERTFRAIVAEASVDLLVVDPCFAGKSSLKHLENCLADIIGFTVICIHADADKVSSNRAMQERVQPLIDIILSRDTNQPIVPIIPIRMTEAWMLADQEAFKNELVTDKSYSELGIKTAVESIANPKAAIETAIRIIDKELPAKQRGQTEIGNLYEELANTISLTELQRLPSYQQFQGAARQALIQANLLPSSS